MKDRQQKPLVLHVDDSPDDLRTWKDAVNASGHVRLELRHPQQVTADDLKQARVVLVDVRLETWPERDVLPALSLQPANGLALLAILQEHAYEKSNDNPRAFALYTAVIKDISRGLVPRSHIVARAHNLEWVFDKNEATLAERVAKVERLASAVEALPNPWPGNSGEAAGRALQKWLALDETASWRDAAWRSVLRCHPPLHEFAEHTHGIGVLRWMLHRILPYPCFLIDDMHLAARLRVDAGSLRTALAASSDLSKRFETVKYAGKLDAFIGRRWWRAGVEEVVFQLAQDDPANLELLHSNLRELAPDLQLLADGNAFPVMDADFNTKDTLAAAGDVVEIVPDDWPPFADVAWALKADAESAPDLKAIVRNEEGA